MFVNFGLLLKARLNKDYFAIYSSGSLSHAKDLGWARHKWASSETLPQLFETFHMKVLKKPLPIDNIIWGSSSLVRNGLKSFLAGERKSDIRYLAAFYPQNFHFNLSSLSILVSRGPVSQSASLQQVAAKSDVGVMSETLTRDTYWLNGCSAQLLTLSLISISFPVSNLFVPDWFWMTKFWKVI